MTLSQHAVVKQNIEQTKLDCIIKADETFSRLSLKGNHKKSTFKMPIVSCKRGGSSHKRGLSIEQVSNFKVRLLNNDNIVIIMVKL